MQNCICFSLIVYVILKISDGGICFIVQGESPMHQNEIIDNNKNYWNENADSWFGTTALPTYGVKFVSEDDLHLFKDVSGKKVLEICCGSGHSLKYLADRNAAELTYINALAKAGFAVEQMIELNDKQTMESVDDNSDKTKKAKMIPISVCFKARKL